MEYTEKRKQQQQQQQNTQSIRELSDSKGPNISVIGVLKGKDRQKETEIFAILMTEVFPNLMKTTNLQVQRAQ